MAFKENSRLNTQNVHRSSGSSGGKGIAVGGGLGGVVLLLIVGAIWGQDGINTFNQITGGGYDFSNVETATNDDTTLADQCKIGEDANNNADCNMVGTYNSLDQFWSDYLPETKGTSYSAPQLQLFSNSVNTGCGSATSATGPFYCPADQFAYVDTAFFDTMKTQLGAVGGQSAEQYVLAHEYGHHIQNLLGDLKYSQTDPQGADSGAVRVELQTDCYAGVWANNASKDSQSEVQVEPYSASEVEAIVNATEVIGDDHIQMTSQGHTDSNTYTHGTSAQRTAWFMAGYNSGDMNKCNTFESTNLDQPQAHFTQLNFSESC